MTEAVAIVVALIFILLAYAGGRIHQWALQVEKDRDRRMPNWLVGGIEDAQAVNIDTLLQVQEMLVILQNRIAQANRILGETRQGDYDTEQPAKRDGKGG